MVPGVNALRVGNLMVVQKVRTIFWCKKISHKVFLKSFCKIQPPHKSVNLFFILVKSKGNLTILWTC